MTQNNRFISIDILRGISVITMIIFHFFYVLDFFDIKNNEMYSGFFGILARFTQITFLSLVGISLSISKHNANSLRLSNEKFIQIQCERAFRILLCALTINLVTYIFLGETLFIKFGILHLISLSIVICVFLADKKYSALTLAIIIFVFSPSISQIISNNYFLYIFGADVRSLYSIDYFPVFPWLSLPLIGVFIGNILLKNKNPNLLLTNKNNKISKPIMFLGQNSLLIYMIHVPIIILILIISGYLQINQIL